MILYFSSCEKCHKAWQNSECHFFCLNLYLYPLIDYRILITVRLCHHLPSTYTDLQFTQTILCNVMCHLYRASYISTFISFFWSKLISHCLIRTLFRLSVPLLSRFYCTSLSKCYAEILLCLVIVYRICWF